MLRSLVETNPNTEFDIYLAHSSLTEDDFDVINECINDKIKIHPIVVDEKLFDDAPVLSRISKETYYRLLLENFLPESVDRILYLDPDIVVINPLDELYNMDLKGNVIAAASHTYGIIEFFNWLRLNLKFGTNYINAGVLLIDVNAWRNTIKTDAIIKFIADNIKKLWLSDQDAINMIFKNKILHIDERKFNLDEKTYSRYFKKGKIDPQWVEKNSIIIHFNGTKKPWNTEKYNGNLGGYFEKFK
jgi:lipopolysaccharide biosynthesis glycosyltransferase